MHELSVARSLIDLSSSHARKQGASRVRRLHLRLGAQSVVLRQFYLCFVPASRGTLCEGAELAVEEVPLTLHCRACGTTGEPAGRSNFRCAGCGAPTSEIVTGREMQLVGLDLEYPRPAAAGAGESNRNREFERER